MKALRIIQILILLVVAAYLFLINNNNASYLDMPFLISMPPALVIAIALLLGWFVGWLGGRAPLWRKNRELNKLQKRMTELENQSPAIRSTKITEESGTPVIPDRSGTFPTDSEYENL
jgi:Lipopolysaccharide assembly protein A domain